MRKMKPHTRRPANTNIDIGLAVIERHRKPGQIISQRDIAEICRCSQQRINQIEKAAIAKIRAAIQAPISEFLTD